MTIQIGVVKAVIGEVTATAADGSSRTLQVSDNAYANDLISTGSDGAIEIEFADGDVMALGRISQALLDGEFFDPNSTDVAAEVQGDDAVLLDDAGNDFLIEGQGDDILSGGDGVEVSDADKADFGTALMPAEGDITDFSEVHGDVIALADVLSNPDNEVAGVEHDGYLQIQVSNSGGLVQVIDVTAIAAADDAAAQIALDNLLSSWIEDGMS